MIGGIIAIGAAAVFIGYLINRPLNAAAEGATEFGAEVANTIYPDDETQQERNDKGAIGNTVDFLFGDGATAGINEWFSGLFDGSQTGRDAGVDDPRIDADPPARTLSDARGRR